MYRSFSTTTFGTPCTVLYTSTYVVHIKNTGGEISTCPPNSSPRLMIHSLEKSVAAAAPSWPEVEAEAAALSKTTRRKRTERSFRGEEGAGKNKA